MIYKMFHSEMRFTDKWNDIFVDGSIEDAIREYCFSKFAVLDSDSGFDDVYYFVIRDPKDNRDSYYKVTHEANVFYFPEWEIENNFNIHKCSEPKFEYPSMDRDWLTVR